MASALPSSKAVTKSNDLRGIWRKGRPPDGLTPKIFTDRERRFFGAAVFVGTEKAPTEAGACGYSASLALAMDLVNAKSRLRASSFLIR